MPRTPSPRTARRLLTAGVPAVALALAGAASASADPGALFTETNNPAGNVVVQYDRAADGTLSLVGSVSTGGLGSSAIGGRQGLVTAADEGRTIYAANAGSDSVTALRRSDGGLRVTGTVPSGGSQPVSVDERDGRVYVLNAGGTANVTAFRAQRDGELVAIPGGSQALPGAVGAAQVSVSPDGHELVVTERLSNRLETLPLDPSGRPGAPVITPSNGTVPFGFAFAGRDTLIVSEAGAGAVSSYRVTPFGGTLSPVTVSAPVGQGAPCWVATTQDEHYAYTGNAAGTISGFAVDHDGSLTALDADGRTATPTLSPRDLGTSRDGRFLYAVSPGNATTGGQVTGYRIATDGSLTEITAAPAPAGLTGIAVS